MSSPKELLDGAIAEVGAAAVLTLLREGLDLISHPGSSPNAHLAERVKFILGDKLQSEVEYQAAMEALRKHGP